MGSHMENKQLEKHKADSLGFLVLISNAVQKKEYCWVTKEVCLPLSPSIATDNLKKKQEEEK